MGGAVYFLLGDGSYDLWRTDGTTAGTVLVKALGTAGGGEREVRIAAAGNRVFFGAPVLHTSDGTSAGTVSLPGNAVPTEMVTLGADAFASDGYRLLKCTTSGPVVMAQSQYYVSNLVVAGPHVCFRRGDVDYTHGFPAPYWTLWRADANAASAFVTSPRNATLVGAVGNSVYFGARSTGGFTVYRDSASTVHVTVPATGVLTFHRGDVYWTAGGRLGRFDSAQATTLDLGPVAAGPGWASLASGVLVFPADDPALGNEPYRTDGSATGTFGLGDIDPTLPGGDTESSDPLSFYDAAGLVYFSAIGDGIGRELFVSDGSPGGTRLVVDLEAGPGSSTPRHFAMLGAEVLFVADVNGLEGVWITDGTAAGTRLLQHARIASDLTTAGAFVFFRALGSNGRDDLWRTDGTSAGTVVVQSLNDLTSDPIHAIGNAAFFHAGYTGLWRVEGTAAPVQVVPAVVSGKSLTVGDFLFFTVQSTVTDSFWRVHASGANATWLADLAPAGGRYAEDLHASHGRVFCWSLVGNTRPAFATDGTQAGTHQLPVPSSGLYLGARFGSVSGKTLVRTPGELFLSDGTPTNTLPLRTIWTRPGPSTNLNRSNYALSVGDRKVYFAANDGWGGLEIWMTDGSSSGTRQVTDTTLGSGDGQFSSATPVLSNGRLVFAAQNLHHGAEPWAVDVGASAQRVGAGCAARTLPPSLSADDPILGASITVRVESAGPLQAGALVIGTPSTGFRHTYVGGGCTLYFAPSAPVVLPFTTDAAGTFRLPGIVVPNLPSLRGLRLMVQTGTGPTAMPLGADLSNGVLLVLGTA